MEEEQVLSSEAEKKWLDIVRSFCFSEVDYLGTGELNPEEVHIPAQKESIFQITESQMAASSATVFSAERDDNLKQTLSPTDLCFPPINVNSSIGEGYPRWYYEQWDDFKGFTRPTSYISGSFSLPPSTAGPWPNAQGGFGLSPDSTNSGSRQRSTMASVEVRLENAVLWEKFNENGTEMIVTKSGR